MPNASRADTVVSGRLIAEVGRISARAATLFISRHVLCVIGQAHIRVDPRPVHARGKDRGGSCRTSRRRAARLRGQPGAHGRIGEVDRLQPLLRRAVAAVGVRVVALGEFLVARLHRIQRGRPAQAQRRHRLAQLGRAVCSVAPRSGLACRRRSRICSGSCSSFVLPGRRRRAGRAARSAAASRCRRAVCASISPGDMPL